MTQINLPEIGNLDIGHNLKGDLVRHFEISDAEGDVFLLGETDFSFRIFKNGALHAEYLEGNGVEVAEEEAIVSVVIPKNDFSALSCLDCIVYELLADNEILLYGKLQLM